MEGYTLSVAAPSSGPVIAIGTAQNLYTQLTQARSLTLRLSTSRDCALTINNTDEYQGQIEPDDNKHFYSRRRNALEAVGKSCGRAHFQTTPTTRNPRQSPIYGLVDPKNNTNKGTNKVDSEDELSAIVGGGDDDDCLGEGLNDDDDDPPTPAPMVGGKKATTQKPTPKIAVGRHPVGAATTSTLTPSPSTAPPNPTPSHQKKQVAATAQFETDLATRKPATRSTTRSKRKSPSSSSEDGGAQDSSDSDYAEKKPARKPKKKPKVPTPTKQKVTQQAATGPAKKQQVQQSKSSKVEILQRLLTDCGGSAHRRTLLEKITKEIPEVCRGKDSDTWLLAAAGEAQRAHVCVFHKKTLVYKLLGPGEEPPSPSSRNTANSAPPAPPAATGPSVPKVASPALAGANPSTIAKRKNPASSDKLEKATSPSAEKTVTVTTPPTEGSIGARFTPTPQQVPMFVGLEANFPPLAIPEKITSAGDYELWSRRYADRHEKICELYSQMYKKYYQVLKDMKASYAKEDKTEAEKEKIMREMNDFAYYRDEECETAKDVYATCHEELRLLMERLQVYAKASKGKLK